MRAHNRWFISIVIFMLIILMIPAYSYALIAGNYLINVRPVNGESIISTPDIQNYISGVAEVSVKYDGKDHGFSFSCLSNDTTNSKFYTGAGVIEQCSAVNELGEEVPYRIVDTSAIKAVYLESPDVGTYTISLTAYWKSGMIQRHAELMVTFTVEKGNLAGAVSIDPYYNEYDGQSHDAMMVWLYGNTDQYTVDYFDPRLNEYVAEMPQVKNTWDSQVFYCRIQTSSPNFIDSQCSKYVSPKVLRKSISISVQDAIKCSGQDDPTIHYDITGLISNEQITGIEILRDEGEEPGLYQTTVLFDANENPNYTATINPGILTIREHEWSDIEYSWSQDLTSVTASRYCSYGHWERETVETVVEEIAPTCTEPGVKTISTSPFSDPEFVKQILSIQTEPAVGHKKIIDEEAFEPTCTENGATESSHCMLCGEVLSEKRIIQALGHKKVIDGMAVAPTCTEEGVTESSHCSVCGEIIDRRQIIPATGHTIVIDPYIAPTYDTDGWTEGSHCSVCNTVIQEQSIITRYSESYTHLYLADNYEATLPKGSMPYNTSSWTETSSRYYLPDDNTVFGISKYEGNVSLDYIATMFKATGNTVFKNPYRPVYYDEIECVLALKATDSGVIITCGFSLNSAFYVITAAADKDYVALAVPMLIVDSIKNYSVEYVWAEDYKSVTGIQKYRYYPDLTTQPTGVTEVVQAHIGTEFANNERGHLISTSDNFAIGCFTAQKTAVSLPVMYIPQSTKTIDEEAFMNSACRAVIIPQGCRGIGAKAFSNCEMLEYVFIPNSVMYEADDAFYNCPKVVVDRQRE